MNKLIAFFIAALVSCATFAQASACNANEDVVTFDWGAPQTVTATGTTATWTFAGATTGTFAVATPGTLRSNTITFNAGITNATWAATFPRLTTQGNVIGVLGLVMDANAPNDGVELTMSFNRPMNKVRFLMSDIDQTGTWQDVLRIFGRLNGITTTLANITPTTPAAVNVSDPLTGARVATAVVGSAACAVTDPACNATVTFANPVDSIVIQFVAGPAVATPVQQVVGLSNFSYCVPRRELILSKTDVTPTFIAGQTGTYTLIVSNLGGTQTAGAYTVTDIISTSGTQFVNPQTPGGGWTCAVSTTTFAQDTVNCGRATALSGNSTTTNLTLTVAVASTLTAAPIVNQAKVFGGGDPNKPTLNATGAVTVCNAANEGFWGGGATYYSGSATGSGCAYEETLLERRANLNVTKTNALTTLTAGQLTTYTVTFSNNGPSSANGSTIQDTPSTGLSSCTVLSCTPTGTATCPGTIANLLAPSTTTIPSFPPGTSVSFQLQCNVTATGL